MTAPAEVLEVIGVVEVVGGSCGLPHMMNVSISRTELDATTLTGVIRAIAYQVMYQARRSNDLLDSLPCDPKGPPDISIRAAIDPHVEDFDASLGYIGRPRIHRTRAYHEHLTV